MSDLLNKHRHWNATEVISDKGLSTTVDISREVRDTIAALTEAAQAVWNGAELDGDISTCDTADLRSLKAALDKATP